MVAGALGGGPVSLAARVGAAMKGAARGIVGAVSPRLLRRIQVLAGADFGAAAAAAGADDGVQSSV